LAKRVGVYPLRSFFSFLLLLCFSFEERTRVEGIDIAEPQSQRIRLDSMNLTFFPPPSFGFAVLLHDCGELSEYFPFTRSLLVVCSSLVPCFTRLTWFTLPPLLFHWRKPPPHIRQLTFCQTITRMSTVLAFWD